MNRSTLARLGVAALLCSAVTAGCGVHQDAPAAPASGSGAATSGSAGAASAAPAVCTGKNDPKAAAPTELTLALVPSGDANKLVESVKPLEAALTQRLGIPVKGTITQDYQASVEAIGANKAQIGMLPSLQMSQACDKYGAVPSMQSLRNGKSTYAAQFFTSNPGKYCTDTPSKGANGMLYCNGTASGNGPAGLDSITKVKGAKVVTLSPASPAGYIFPVASLKQKGIDVKDMTTTQVTANDAAVLSVYKGDAEVGFSYWDARTVVKKDTPDVGDKVVVFALTDEVPNDGISLSGKLSPEWQKKIHDAFADYAATDDGKQTLTSIYQITGLKDADPAALVKTQQLAKSIGIG